MHQQVGAIRGTRYDKFCALTLLESNHRRSKRKKSVTKAEAADALSLQLACYSAQGTSTR